MKLYEITGAMAGLIQRYNEVESDEQLLELEKALKDTEIAFYDKALAVTYHIRNIEGDVTAVENELTRLENVRRRLITERDWFKEYLKRSMELVNSQQIKSPTIKIAIVNNPPSVVVENEALVPEKYKRIITEVKIDKQAIKDAWKEGIGVDGTHIEQKTRLKIS